MADKSDPDFRSPMAIVRLVRAPLIVTGLLVLASICQGLFMFSTPAGHASFLMFGGSTYDQVYEPGPHFKWPWMSAINYPTRTITESYKSNPRDSNNQFITTQVSVQLSVNPQAVVELKRAIGDLEDVKKIIIDPQIRQVTAANTPKKTPEGLVWQRPDLVGDIQKELQEAISEQLREKGVRADAIKVGQVGITEFEFNPQLKQTLENKAVAGVKNRTATAQARITQIDADAAGKEKEILAKAEATKTQMIADAGAYAARTKGDALARATEVLPKFEAIMNWLGNAPRMVIGEKTPVIVQPAAPASK